MGTGKSKGKDSTASSSAAATSTGASTSTWYTTTSCYNCGGKGHLSKNCPLPMQKGGKGGHQVAVGAHQQQPAKPPGLDAHANELETDYQLEEESYFLLASCERRHMG